jgi:hypothetical protein
MGENNLLEKVAPRNLSLVNWRKNSVEISV